MGLIKSLENVDMFCQLFSFFFFYIYKRRALFKESCDTVI